MSPENRVPRQIQCNKCGSHHLTLDAAPTICGAFDRSNVVSCEVLCTPTVLWDLHHSGEYAANPSFDDSRPQLAVFCKHKSTRMQQGATVCVCTCVKV